MTAYLVYALGFFAQALFGSRMVVQWFYSERQGSVVSPTVFWVISLVASFLFLIYGVLQRDPVILVGQTLSYYIYIRNLQLKGVWRQVPLAVRLCIWPLPVVLMVILWQSNPLAFQRLFSAEAFSTTWVWIGTVGQLMLNLRYLYQWYRSEQAGESILPLGFWTISAVASMMVVGYALQKPDPVLLLSQSMGLLVYLRNIALHYKSIKTI
jgi:lipid-A-disaccharide synthase-like uncharacterized protein